MTVETRQICHALECPNYVLTHELGVVREHLAFMLVVHMGNSCRVPADP